NSGHWTIEGAKCSQFENHLRAVAGLPLGSTAKVGESAMLNFLGSVPPTPDVLRVADCHLHHYGKAFKPGRKVGHATLRCQDAETLKARIAEVQALIARGGTCRGSGAVRSLPAELRRGQAVRNNGVASATQPVETEVPWASSAPSSSA